jgi:DNA-binding Lrp family transcriptional regulator
MQDDTTLDSFDLRIARRYQHDTRVPASTIAAEVGLSTAAVQRRLKRMRELGVIEAEVALIAPKKVGLPVTCLVAVELVRESPSANEQFKRKMARYPQVQQCYYVTGTMDFMLIVLARDMEDYEAFSRKAFLEDSNVKSFTTHVVLERVKTGGSVPIDER